jgi:hypothetical protein
MTNMSGTAAFKLNERRLNSIVCIDTTTMTLSRYEVGGAHPRLTHKGIASEENFHSHLGELAELFRLDPPTDFRV